MHPMTASRLFQRGLQEKLADYRKSAFVPMGAAAGEKTGQQAAGPTGAPPPPPGGAPMDPMAGGAPPPGGAPMDPMAGGAPPPGGAPMDPMAGGAPPGEEGGLPPLPPLDELAPPEGGDGGGGLTSEDAETVDQITERTMDIVRQTLEMVGKAKPVEQPKEEPAEPAAEQAEPAPEQQPGPITGQPGFDPGMIGGPLNMPKTAQALKAKLAQMATTSPAEQEPVTDRGEQGFQPVPTQDINQDFRNRLQAAQNPGRASAGQIVPTDPPAPQPPVGRQSAGQAVPDTGGQVTGRAIQAGLKRGQ